MFGIENSKSAGNRFVDVMNNFLASRIVAIVVSGGTSLKPSARAQESIKRLTSSRCSELASGSSRAFIGSTDDGVSDVFESGVEDEMERQ